MDDLYSMADAHWGWVTNQVRESRVTDGFGGRLSSPCKIDSSAVSSFKNISYDAGNRTNPKTRSFDVQELSAEVVGVQFKNSSSNRVTAKASASTSASDSYAKVYSSSACQNRGSQSPSAQISKPLQVGSTATFYVLISNSRSGPESTFNVEVSYEDRPTK
jgi:hypothetical protein